MDGPDLESCSIPRSDEYAAPLLHTPSTPSKKSFTLFMLAAVAAVLFIVLAPVLDVASRAGGGPVEKSPALELVTSGVSQGVSEKSTGPLLGASRALGWTNAVLLWQRTAYHFQPESNFMSDPNGPMYYKGWYHFFYQYNPVSAVWDHISWGHAVSRDLIHWLYLPVALGPSHWYDLNGVLTGSITLLPSGRIIMLYTGNAYDFAQVQCLATPADPSDPLLIRWVKSDANPVLLPPPGIGLKDFRDPTIAWYVPAESAWRVAFGSKYDEGHTGIVLVYRTTDFVSYELLPGVMHAVAGTGMWECLDLFPVSTESAVGLDMSVAPGPGVKHVLKASVDDDKHDYYAIGTYMEAEGKTGKWVPDDPEADVGIGLRYDYGKYYASKTFFDPEKQRRVLWGWTGETDSRPTDLQKGWASVQTIPRTVVLDQKTGNHLLLWPVEEVEKLRLNSHDFNATEIKAGAVLPVNVNETTQLDIEAVFEVDPSAVAETVEADVMYNCSTSGGAAGRGALGPFGLLVFADEDLLEQTAVYFYIVRGVDGGLQTFLCQDNLRSSMANDIIRRVYGSTVPVLDGELLTVRVLVDHSIVESFAQGGRTCITSRAYPTVAINGAARMFLFNNATSASVRAKSLKIWQMNSTSHHRYPSI